MWFFLVSYQMRMHLCVPPLLVSLLVSQSVSYSPSQDTEVHSHLLNLKSACQRRKPLFGSPLFVRQLVSQLVSPTQPVKPKRGFRLSSILDGLVLFIVNILVNKFHNISIAILPLSVVAPSIRPVHLVIAQGARVFLYVILLFCFIYLKKKKKKEKKMCQCN